MRLEEKTGSQHDFRVWMVLGFVLFVSLFFRLKSAWFGYPLITHPDEPTLVNNALRIYKTQEFNPHFFNYPSFVIYLQYVTTTLVSFFYSTFLGVPFQKIPLVDLHVSGRVVAAVGSTVSVFMTYLVGARMAGVWGGVFAAAMVGFSPLHIRNSALVTTDIWVAIFSVFVLFFSTKIPGNPSFRNYILSGVFVGLSAGSKYTAITFFAAVLVAHCFSGAVGWSRFFSPKLIVSGCVALFTFVATTPYSVLDSSEFLADVVFESKHYRFGHPGNQAEGNYSYGLYAAELFSLDGLGAVGFVFSMLGISLLLYGRKFVFWSVAILPVVLYVFVGNYKVYFSRNVVAMVPALSLCAAYFVVVHLRKLSMRGGYVFCGAALLAISMSLGPVLYRAAIDLKERLLPDTRVVSLSWVNSNLPAGSVVAIEPYTFPLQAERFHAKGLGLMGLVTGLGRIDGNVDYVIVNSKLYGRYFDQLGNPKPGYEQQAAVYQNFFNTNHLIHEVDPVAGETSGPTVRVYENSLKNMK